MRPRQVSEDEQQVGERLRQALKDSNLTMKDLADRCHVSRPAVSNWIKHGTIAKKHLQRVASITGTSVEFLLYGSHSGANGYSIPADRLARRFDALPHDHQREIWFALEQLLQPRKRR